MTLIKILLFVSYLFLWCHGNTIPKFVPQGYHLDLVPDVDTGVLKGLVCINIAAYAEPSNIIELDADPAVSIHYKSIRVSELLKDGGGNTTNRTNFDVVAVERILYNTGTLRINLKQKLQRDITYQVYINFESFLKNDTTDEPFYMRIYFDQLINIERKFVVMDLTNFGCYKAFPCFDKPDYKSWISLNVVRKPSFYVLFAAPVNYTTNMVADGSLVKDHFLTTLPMSINSLAMVVSDYTMINTMQSLIENDEFTTWNQLDETPSLVLDSDVVKLVVKCLEERFTVSFPLSTFHVLAVPKSVNIPYINAFGLLVFNESTSSEKSEFIKNIVFGALSQWFVRMATPVMRNSTIHALIFHFKNVIAEEIMKKLKIYSWNDFNYGQTVFTDIILKPTNALLSSDCITTKIIPALLFNVLDKVFGADILNEAMHIFLRKKEFKMYTEDDIWNAINEVVRLKTNIDNNLDFQNIKQIFESWNKFDLLPVVSVHRDYESNFVNITQEPFVYATNAYDLFKFRESIANFQPHWIPIAITQSNTFFNNQEIIGWMTNSNQIFELKSANSYDFIIFNPSHLAPFVVNYDDRNWRMLVENFNVLPESIKLQLLVDSAVLANSGLLDYSVFLNMSAALIPDEQYLSLWLKYGRIVESVLNRFHGTLGRKYEQFVYHQVSRFFTTILKSKMNNYPKEVTRKIKKIRNSVACRINRASCFTPYEYEILMYEARMGKLVSDDLNCEIIRNMSLSDWKIIANGLLHALRNYSLTDRYKILSFITCTENPSAFETYMNLIFLNFNKFPYVITEQDQKHVISKIDSRHRRLLLHFVKKNFDLLKDRLNYKIWRELIENLVKFVQSEEDIQELVNFYTQYAGQFDSAEEVIKKGLDIISLQVNWERYTFPYIEKLLDNITNDLKNSYYVSTPKVG